MTVTERNDLLQNRKRQHLPWHGPPHFFGKGNRQYLITAACFEHAPVIGESLQRLAQCELEVLEICAEWCSQTHAWSVLPNHYHLLVQTDRVAKLVYHLGRWHGKTARQWNIEDQTLGRKVWFRSVERLMQSERHFFATLNYIHHNPVKHGYVQKWQEWPFGSARPFLEEVGRGKAVEIWTTYPILNYGKDWDAQPSR